MDIDGLVKSMRDQEAREAAERAAQLANDAAQMQARVQEVEELATQYYAWVTQRAHLTPMYSTRKFTGWLIGTCNGDSDGYNISPSNYLGVTREGRIVSVQYSSVNRPGRVTFSVNASAALSQYDPNQVAREIAKIVKASNVPWSS
jgi:hypothetical protein